MKYYTGFTFEQVQEEKKRLIKEQQYESYCKLREYEKFTYPDQCSKLVNMTNAEYDLEKNRLVREGKYEEAALLRAIQKEEYPELNTRTLPSLHNEDLSTSLEKLLEEDESKWTLGVHINNLNDLVVSCDDFQKVFEAIENPPEPNEKLKQAKQNYAKFIAESPQTIDTGRSNVQGQ